ncbi:FAD-dependent oxidoreductase [Wenzhouxiangella sp. AB-CW3]|uniref:FAD-dependent oxidoreductase n=1 Tax=Wenzhouxiangella sp. AB-CW3 TaxID=2771012 RepID=UPI00168AF74E|nr:FAD-dependent oxidoreductase [Wenzhouxiangella sp. AB-CW3]QOC21940.1 FAD-dependent oxidoreductase [Wenzhouxiangella sp. AB-CW3]
MSLNVAVIGSGIAGLAAARACRDAGSAVRLFEAREELGMASQALEVDGGIVDVPLRVMGEGRWDRTLELARRVGMETFPADVQVSCSWMDQRTWFRSGQMPLTGWPMFGSLRHLGLRGLRLGLGLWRLARRTRDLLQGNDDMRLDEFAWRYVPDRLFWRGLILPMLSTICTCSERRLNDWPARQLLALLDDIVHSGELLRLKGGAAPFARALAADIPAHVGSPVHTVKPDGEALAVRNARGDGGVYDRVIVATQANQLDFLDDDAFGAERQLLAGIPYASGELVVHRDPRFMPRRRREWTALNFLMDRGLENSMFTVWVNAVEPTLAGRAPVFQTWNPLFEPRDEHVIAGFPMQRAVVNQGNAGILEQLARWHDQPGRRLFYCGSWACPGVPLLETGVQSAEAVVSRLIRDPLGPAGQVVAG